MATVSYPGKFHGFSIAFVAALFLAVMVAPARGQEQAPAKTDETHLADQSSSGFDSLLSRFKTQQKFSEVRPTASSPSFAFGNRG